MTHSDGKMVARNALDAVAVAGERYPESQLLAVQTILVMREPTGHVTVLNVAKEKA